MLTEKMMRELMSEYAARCHSGTLVATKTRSPRRKLNTSDVQRGGRLKATHRALARYNGGDDRPSAGSRTEAAGGVVQVPPGAWSVCLGVTRKSGRHRGGFRDREEGAAPGAPIGPRGLPPATDDALDPARKRPRSRAR